MIVDLDIIKKYEEFKNIDDEKIIRKLKAIEKSIRKYTNNNFMDLKFRFYGEIKNNEILVKSYPYLKEKDNIELSYSLNDDVFTIKTVDKEKIILDTTETLFDCKNVMITKVVYPEDVQEGVINMLKWDFGMRNKVGIKSETISRHSITYFDMDKNNSIKGYPASLINFLNDYMKARF